MYMYHMSGDKLNNKFRKNIEQFISFMKRVVTKAKLNEGTLLGEGEQTMSFDVYKKICETLLKDGDEDAAFAHLFLILEWDLIA